jgi:hypothetical protein
LSCLKVAEIKIVNSKLLTLIKTNVCTFL